MLSAIVLLNTERDKTNKVAEALALSVVGRAAA